MIPKVVRYKPEHHEQVKALIVRIMEQEFGDAVGAYPTDDLDHPGKSYGALGEAFFVALDGTRVIGTVAIKKEDERVALLRRLFVAPEQRGRKIGSKLIDSALSFCRNVGYEEVVFKTTSKMTGANSICQKSGFVQRARLNLGMIELLKFSLFLLSPAGLARK